MSWTDADFLCFCIFILNHCDLHLTVLPCCHPNTTFLHFRIVLIQSPFRDRFHFTHADDIEGSGEWSEQAAITIVTDDKTPACGAAVIALGRQRAVLVPDGLV